MWTNPRPIYNIFEYPNTFNQTLYKQKLYQYLASQSVSLLSYQLRCLQKYSLRWNQCRDLKAIYKHPYLYYEYFESNQTYCCINSSLDNLLT